MSFSLTFHFRIETEARYWAFDKDDTEIFYCEINFCEYLAYCYRTTENLYKLALVLLV